MLPTSTTKIHPKIESKQPSETFRRPKAREEEKGHAR